MAKKSTKYSLKASSMKAQVNSNGYFPEKYDLRIYGSPKLGETVTIKYDGKTYTGEVVYIHPRNRFFTIQTENGMRESFYFPLPQKTEG